MKKKKAEILIEIEEKSGLFKLKEFLMLFDPQFAQLSFYAKNMRNTSRCDHTTSNIISFLNASPPFKMTKFKNLDYQENLPLLKEFFDQKEDKLSHSFFLFQNRLPSHSYIIQKKWNEEKFMYRIHQSWRDEFTLGQWEGLDKWPDTEFTKQNIFKFEYRGKDLDVLQVKQFLKEMVEISITMEKQLISEESFDNTCDVTRYDADVGMLQAYEKIIDQSNIKKMDFKPKDMQKQSEEKAKTSHALESSQTTDLLRSPTHSGSSLFLTKKKEQTELTQTMQKIEDKDKEKTTTHDSSCTIL